MSIIDCSVLKQSASIKSERRTVVADNGKGEEDKDELATSAPAGEN